MRGEKHNTVADGHALDGGSPLNPDRRAIIFWYVSTLALLACLIYAKRPDALNNPQFWAEDGGLLFQEWQDFGVSAVFRPASGYLMVIQRLLAILGSSWGPAPAPMIFNISALASVLCIGFFIMQSRIDLAIWGKILMVLGIALIPHSGEVFLNIANLQHITASILVILAIQREPTRQLNVFTDIMLLVLVGLSGPYIIILAPLFVFRCVFKGWTSYNIRLLTVVLGLALVQGSFLVTADRMTNSLMMSRSIAEWWSTIGIVLPGHLWFAWSDLLPIQHCGSERIKSVISAPAFFALTPALLVMLGYLTLTSKRRFPICICFTTSALFFGAALFDCRDDPMRLYRFWGIGRYFFITYLCVTWALIFRLSEETGGRWTLPKLLALSFLLLTVLSASRIFVWPAQPDMYWRAFVEMRNPSEPTVIPTTPRPWRVVLKPDRLHSRDR